MKTTKNGTKVHAKTTETRKRPTPAEARATKLAAKEKKALTEASKPEAQARAKATLSKDGAAPLESQAPAPAAKAKVRVARTLDMSLALAKPLTLAEMRVLRKIGDADRAIAARVGKLLAKYEGELSIPGVTGGGILDSVRRAEAIAPDEALAEVQHARLNGARLVADDETWASIVKLHRRLQNEGSDHPEALADFKFLMDYIAKRSFKVEDPARAKRASKSDAQAQGAPAPKSP